MTTADSLSNQQSLLLVMAFVLMVQLQSVQILG